LKEEIQTRTSKNVGPKSRKKLRKAFAFKKKNKRTYGDREHTTKGK